MLQDIFSSYVSLIPVTLAQSLALGFVVLGIMIPFRMLSFPDLTSEGAFPLGGCVCGVLMAAGMSPLPAILVALLAGSVVLVLIVELLNTALEAAIDRVSFELHDLSKRAKDTGSAAVFLSLLLCASIWLSALWQRYAHGA